MVASGAALHWWHTPPSPAEIQRLIAAHDTDAALRAVATRLQDDPTDDRILALADSLYNGLCDPLSGEPIAPRATAALRRIVIVLHSVAQDRGDDPLAQTVFGEFALTGGSTALAAEALERAASLGIPEDRVDVPLAIAQLRVGDYQHALRDAHADTAATPHHRVMLLVLRARAQNGLSQTEAARASLQAALAIDPGNAEALSRLGMLVLWQDRNGAAAAALLLRARAAAPDATATLRLAGEYAYATGDFQGSAAAFRALIQRGVPETFDPTPPSLGLARALTYAGDLAAAQSALDASGLPPRDPSLRYYRALLAYRGGQFARAADLAQPLETLLPNYPPLDLLMGAASLANGYPAIAVARLTHYLAAVPADAAAQHLLLLARQRLTDAKTAAVQPRELLADFGFSLSTAAGSGAGSGGKDGS